MVYNFMGMNSDEAKRTDIFFRSYKAIQYQKHDILLRPDEPVPGIFYLEKGLVEQYLISKTGETLVVHIFRPGSFFQMVWAVNSPANAYYYEALTPTVVRKVPLPDVVDFLHNNPDVLYHFTSRLLAGLAGLLKRLEFLVLDPASVKVASILSYYARHFGEKNGSSIMISLPLTHREIAAWIGTTRETASIQIEEFKRQGLLSYKGRSLIINDLKRLEKVIPVL